jgi:hypothetical protein
VRGGGILPVLEKRISVLFGFWAKQVNPASSRINKVKCFMINLWQE